MNVKFLMLPLFLSGVLMVGCDDRASTKSPEADAAAKAADAKASADKAAADAKAAVKKNAADAKSTADKAAADADANADKAAANAKAAAAKNTADTKAAAEKDAADAVRAQASKLLGDLQAAVKAQKWADAGPLIKQLDDIRDKLAADLKANFDGLKKQYDENKR